MTYGIRVMLRTAILALVIGGACACGSNDDPIESVDVNSLKSFYDETDDLAAALTTASSDVDAVELDTSARYVTDAARTVTETQTYPLEDPGQAWATVRAIGDLRQEISIYIGAALHIAEESPDRDQVASAVKAIERAAEFMGSELTSSAYFEVLMLAESTAFERDALRYEDEDAEGYLEAIEAVIRTGIALENAYVEISRAQAAVAVARFSDADALDRAYRVLSQAEDSLKIAEEASGDAWADRIHYTGRIEWNSG